MHRQGLVTSFVLLAVLTWTVGDCFASPVVSNQMAQQQSMQCCATQPCTHANRDQDCCQTMSTVEGQQFAPKAKFVPAAPDVVLAAPIAPVAVVGLTIVVRPKVEIREHGPPIELYTTYHSFLI